MKKVFLLSIIILLTRSAYSQGCSNANITLQSDIPSTCNALTMTMKQDILGRPYLYVANKEAGLKIYDITNLNAPVLVKTIPIDSLDMLHVMNLSQDSNYLYLALGNSFNNNQNPGMAIIDVSNPETAFKTDVWNFTGNFGGSGIVKVENNYAYLGAMYRGLVILDITNKYNITFVSQFIPDRNYPTLNPDTSKYNARGMQVKNDIVYLCYDAGGFRIINTTNKLNPEETGRYCNPALNGLPRAYNNLILDDTLVFIAVDYCGMEILNITDTSNVSLLSWWNPWDCQSNSLNWFHSPGYANEIEFNKNCSTIFLSTGNSQMRIVDVSNPLIPDSCNYYGTVGDSIAAWGLGLHNDNIFLAYICSVIPFSSNYTGVKILTYSPCTTGKMEIKHEDNISVYPNPSSSTITISNLRFAIYDLRITDVFGRIVYYQPIRNQQPSIINLPDLSNGIYYWEMKSDKGIEGKGKIVIMKN